jgi:DNA (cytosine-5)-methyltransferase 1
VFVVASARDGFDPAAVLLEFEGVRRDTPPRREAGQAASGGATGRAGERSHWDGDFPHPTLNQSAKGSGGVGASNQELFSQRGAYLAPAKQWPADIAPTLNAHFGEKQGLEDQHAFGGAGLFVPADITHTLRGEGFDASEDGTGRGTPLVPVQVSHTLQTQCGFATEDGTGRGSPLVPVAYSIMPQNSGRDYKAREVEVAQPIMAGGPVGGNQGGDYIMQPVAFSYKDSGADAANDLSPTPRALGAYDANGGGQMAVAFPIDTMNAIRNDDDRPKAGVGVGEDGDPSFTISKGHSHAVAVSLRGRDGGGTAELGGDIQNALRASQGGGDKPHVLAAVFPIDMYNAKRDPEKKDAINRNAVGVGNEGDPSYTLNRVDVHAVATNMAVRRLTPVECERLQGFPDGYTNIPWKKKPADQCPDGPRYKALGNSMAVPVMRWIGARIARHLRGEL